jgi:succinate-acetate transporter protein
MATISSPPLARQEAGLDGARPRATSLDWGNSAPLALLAFAVTTFMLSMVNANAVSVGATPVVLGVALMFRSASSSW